MSQRDKLPRKPPVPKRSEMPPSILKPAASAAAAADSNNNNNNNAGGAPSGRLGRNVSPLPSFAHVTARVDSGRGTATPTPPAAVAALPKQAGTLRPRSNSSTASGGPRSGGALPPAAKSAMSVTPALRTANLGGGGSRSKNPTPTPPLAQQRQAGNSQTQSSAGTNNNNKENASQPQHFLGTPRNSTSPRKSNVLRHSASWSALIHEESDDDDDDEFLMPEQQLSSGNTLMGGRSSQQLFVQQDADIPEGGGGTSFADLVAATEQQQQQQQASENGAAQPRSSLRAFLGNMFSAFAQKETTVASPPRPPVAVATSVAAASVVNSHGVVSVSSGATPPLALGALKGDSQPQLSGTRHGSASPTTKRRLSVRFDEKIVESVVSQNPSATATRDTSPNSHASAAASKRLLELSAATAEEDDDDDSRNMRAADMSVVGGVTPATARRAAPPNTPADGMPTAQREQHMRQAETRNSWFSGGAGGGMLAALFGNGSVSPLPPADGAVGDRNFNRQSEQQQPQQEDGAAQGRSASRKIANAAVPTSSVSSMHVAVSSTPNAAGLLEDAVDNNNDAAGGNGAESEQTAQTEQRPAPRGSWFQRFSASLARSFSPPTRNPDNKVNLGADAAAAASEVSVASDAVASQQQQEQEQQSASRRKSKKSGSGSKKQDADSVARVLADEASSGDDEVDHFLSSSRKRSGSSSSSKGPTAEPKPQRTSSRGAAARAEDGAAQANPASASAAAATGEDEFAAADQNEHNNDNVDGDIPVASPPPRNPSSSSVGGKKAPSKQSAAAASPTKKKSASLTANSKQSQKKQSQPESSSSSSSSEDDDDDDEEIEDDDEELPSMKWTAAQLKALAQRKKLDVDAKATKAEILLAWSQKTGNALSAADSAAVKKSKSVQRSKSKRG